MSVPMLRVLALDQGSGVWGAQRYLLRLAPLLADRGVHITLASPRREFIEEWRDLGLTGAELALPIERSIRRGDRISLRRACTTARGIGVVARGIGRTARAVNADVVLANSHWIHVDAALAGRRYGIPVVLHLHEEAMPGVGAALRGFAVAAAARSVAVSSAVAEGLPSVVQRRVDVIPNGLDVDEWRRMPTSGISSRAGLGIGRDDVLALALTRLDPVKRIEDLVLAVARLDRSVKLVVAGTTSGYPDYEAEIRDLAKRKAPDRIHFIGHRRDTVEWLSAADIFVHAGVVEGMPLGLLEAQACEVPVVAYSVAGVPEAIVNGVTGLLADREDWVALSDAIERLANSPELRAQMGYSGRSHIVANHGIVAQADSNLRVLRAVSALAPSRESA